MNNKKFFFLCIDFVCCFGLIGFAVSFTKYFGHTYFLPLMPNVFDSIFIVFCAIYFIMRIYIK